MSGWQTRDPAQVGLDPADYTTGQVPVKDAADGFVPGEAGGSATHPDHQHPDYSETSRTLTDPPAGGWSWFGDPRAVHHDGVTYFGYVNNSGDVCVRSYNHTTDAVSAETVLNAALDVDDHINPSLLVRESDGRILAFYCAHNDTTMRLRISTNPGDISTFGAEVSLHSQLGGAQHYDYPNPMQLTGETDDPIYLFYRDRPATTDTRQIARSTSTDDGANWSTQTIVLSETDRWLYWKISPSGDDRIDFAVTDGHPTVSTPATSLYHFYYKGGSYYRTDGTVITAPLALADLTLVHDGPADGKCWVWDVAVDPITGHPRIVYATFPTDTDHRYRYARWTGTSWETHEVVAGGGPISNQTSGPSLTHYSGGIVLDHDRPAVVYASVQTGASSWEIRRLTTTDGGATWASTDLTPGVDDKQVRPVVVRNSAPELRALWMDGTYTNFVVWNTGTAGSGRIASSSPDGGVTPEQVRDAGRWEVVVTDSPPVAVTDDDETDWLYAWTGDDL